MRCEVPRVERVFTLCPLSVCQSVVHSPPSSGPLVVRPRLPCSPRFPLPCSQHTYISIHATFEKLRGFRARNGRTIVHSRPRPRALCTVIVEASTLSQLVKIKDERAHLISVETNVVSLTPMDIEVVCVYFETEIGMRRELQANNLCYPSRRT